MVLINYHELTMNEPRDSPQRKRQFLVICTVMAAVFMHAAVSSGSLLSVDIQDGEFPGGKFVYKRTKRDFAASMSLLNNIGETLGLKRREFAEKLYTLYLDDPNRMGGRRQRFAGGLLVNKKEYTEYSRTLMESNKQVKPPTPQEIQDLGAVALWPRLSFQEKKLPKVKAAIMHFPFTDGFTSAIVLSWKIIPALRKYAKRQTNSDDIVVISTCNVQEQICTHYAPLQKNKHFLLGEPNTEDYLQAEPDTGVINWPGVWRSLRKPYDLVMGKGGADNEL